MNLFVTGIGTNVGKTIVSAILTEALQADYWKPIQSGVSEGKDSDLVKSLIGNSKTVIHPETYLLKEPLSPNIAALLENISIDLSKINLPITQNNLIIEGAGGALVPINSTNFVIDIAKKNNCEIVLVLKNYLGCINHTLLTINYLLQNQFKINYLIFNGDFDSNTKNTILNFIPKIKTLKIPELTVIEKNAIKSIATTLKL